MRGGRHRVRAVSQRREATVARGDPLSRAHPVAGLERRLRHIDAPIGLMGTARFDAGRAPRTTSRRRGTADRLEQARARPRRSPGDDRISGGDKERTDATRPRRQTKVKRRRAWKVLRALSERRRLAGADLQGPRGELARRRRFMPGPGGAPATRANQRCSRSSTRHAAEAASAFATSG